MSPRGAGPDRTLRMPLQRIEILQGGSGRLRGTAKRDLCVPEIRSS